MASAAFPGAFNSVTLHRYPLLPAPIAERLGPVPDGYVHLLDGGPADNLGVESLLRLVASSSYRTTVQDQPFKPFQPTAMQRTLPAPCLIIVVDAFPEGVSARNDNEPDPRTFKDHFVDFNFMSAFDAFLARRRSDFLTLAGLRTRDRPLGPDVPVWVRPDGFVSYTTEPAYRFTTIEFPLPTWERGATLDVSTQIRPASTCSGGETKGCRGPDTAVCSIWHIALDNVASMPVVRKSADGDWVSMPVQPSGMKDDPAFYYRTKLRWVTSQIDTDFKLAGPPGCNAEFLQAALYAAARVAVREEDRYRTAACRWFRDQGLAVSAECETPIAPMAESDLPLPIAADAPLMGRSPRPSHQAVRCVAGISSAGGQPAP